MNEIELKKALSDLTTSLEGKTSGEIKTAITAFETKHKDLLSAEIKSALEKAKVDSDLELKKLQDHLDILDVKLKEGKVGKKEKTAAQEIKEQEIEIKAVLGRTSSKEIEIKAVTNRASVSGNTQAFDISDIGQLATRKLSMFDVFPKFPISSTNNNGTVRYWDWDEATSVRSADMIAEGSTFPESTAKWEEFNIKLKKVGDTIPVTEEFFEDEAMFAAEVSHFLTTNVDLKIDDQLANGDGTGQNLTGLVASVNAYTPVASGITDPSIYDLVPKVKEAITTTGGAKYNPNVMFMNIADINSYKLKKDDNNNYIMPPFVSRDGQVIDAVLVIEANVITPNTMVLGDNRFARIYEKAGVILSQGTINAQFTSDMTTLKVRRRLLFLIRNVDKTGWLKVTDIAAALVTLGS